MAGKIQAEIRVSHASIEMEVEAFLNIQRTAELHIGQVTQLLRPHGLSPAQYNVLRILRGSGNEGLPCGEIANRMISRDPDITRLIDRLSRRGLVTRVRGRQDRRVVEVAITDRGREVLRGLDAHVDRMPKAMLGHLGARKLAQLGKLLEHVIAEIGAFP